MNCYPRNNQLKGKSAVQCVRDHSHNHIEMYFSQDRDRKDVEMEKLDALGNTVFNASASGIIPDHQFQVVLPLWRMLLTTIFAWIWLRRYALYLFTIIFPSCQTGQSFSRTDAGSFLWRITSKLVMHIQLSLRPISFLHHTSQGQRKEFFCRSFIAGFYHYLR